MGARRERFARYFAQELAKIKNPAIREFVLECVDVICPEYFFQRAASSTGKYHPEFTLGDGGLCRHVRYTIYWYEQLLRCWLHDGGKTANDIDSIMEVDGQKVDVMDLGIAALLLHDVVKDGDEARTAPRAAKINAYHGVEMADAIRDRVLPGKQATLEQALIMYGVAAHMGRWTKPFEFAPFNLEGSAARKFALLVHSADYCASRRLDEVVPMLAASRP